MESHLSLLLYKPGGTFERRIDKLCIQEGLDMSKRKDKKLIENGLNIVREEDIAVEYHPRHDLNMMAPGQVHQGFLLDCSPLNFEEMERMPDTLLDRPYPVWLALDEVHDPHNLGAMIRTAVFLGIGGVVVSRKNSAPLTPAVSKVSSGAMEMFPIHACSQMPKLLNGARKRGWTVLGADVNKDAIDYNTFQMDSPTILVMGNEAQGLRYTVQAVCDGFLKIESRSHFRMLDSLNVSVAAGILMGRLLYYANHRTDS